VNLEAELAALRARVPDPSAGIFGPGSAVWEVNRHSVIFLGAGRAALLQLAHPWVAQAVWDHSSARTDPVGRFNRTFLRVFDMVYGHLDAACHSAERVHRIHEHIQGHLAQAAGPFAQGSAYRANDPDALMWVHATLAETSITVHEQVLGPLPLEFKERYYAESQRFAALFGIPREAQPRDWSEFEAYNARMWTSDVLTVTDTAREIAQHLFQPLHPLLTPLFLGYRRLTAALLPPAVREGFGLPVPSAAERRMFEVGRAAIERTHRFWPRRLRELPAYHEARRRLAGKAGPDPLGALLHRLLVGEAPRRG